MVYSLYFLFLFASGIIGFIVSLILFFSKNDKTLSNKLLAITIFTIALIVMSNSMYATSFFLKFPHFYRLFSWLGFCIGPVSYLYVRTVLEQSFSLKRRDALFLIPSLIYFIHRLPFTLLPADKKIEIITQNLLQRKLIMLEPEGMLPIGWAAFIRITYGIVFIFLQFDLLVKWKKRIKQDPHHLLQNKEILNWLTLFTLLLLSTYVLIGIATVFNFNNTWDFGTLIILNMSITTLIMSAVLFKSPNILYGLSGWLQEETQIKETNEAIVENQILSSSVKQTLSLAERSVFKNQIEQHFNKFHPFTAEGYSLKDLSNELKIPSYQLSAFINQEYEKNFNEFINDARINYLLALKTEDPEFNNYTLEHIGKKIGFNSRTTFISAVKKRTGKTPSQLLKENQ